MIVFSTPYGSQANADGDVREQRRQQCIGWMVSGYPSGLDEKSCVSEFSLPSAFLFKCSRAQVAGYDSKSQREACKLYFVEAVAQADRGYINQ